MVPNVEVEPVIERIKSIHWYQQVDQKRVNVGADRHYWSNCLVRPPQVDIRYAMCFPRVDFDSFQAIQSCFLVIEEPMAQFIVDFHHSCYKGTSYYRMTQGWWDLKGEGVEEGPDFNKYSLGNELLFLFDLMLIFKALLFNYNDNCVKMIYIMGNLSSPSKYKPSNRENVLTSHVQDL